jgi:photosystem II stability/assembly factor-like uncharacterized protein
MAYGFQLIEKILSMRKAIFAFVFLLLQNFVLNAQWTLNGPYGGSVFSLQANTNYFFAGTANGIFRSADGQNWSESGLQKKSVGSIAVCGSTVFAGVTGYGVYKSNDNGTNWILSSNGLNDLNFSMLFCSSAGIFNSAPDGVYFSSDNGNSWTFANNGIPSTYVIYSFAQVGSTVFGGTYGMGLYKSTNNGGNWTSVGGGFPSTSFVYSLLAIGNTVYAGTSSGVMKSTDGGQNWSASNNGFPSGMWATQLATVNNVLYAGTYSEGIYVSGDGGNNWTAMNNGIPDLPLSTGLPHNYPRVSSVYADANRILAGTWNGMYHSVSGSNNWTEASNGIKSVGITGLSANTAAVFAGSEFTGMYVSMDHGSTWSRKNTGLASFDVMCVHTATSATYIGTLNDRGYATFDNGDNWINKSNGLSSDPKIIRSDTSNGKVFAVTRGAQFTPQKLFQTTNNGNTWIEIPTGFTSNYTSLYVSGADIYVGTDTGKIYFTNNNGGNWSLVNSNLPAATISEMLKSSGKIFAATGAGLFESSNNGASWNSITNGIPSDTISDVMSANGMLYAAVPGYGVYTSSNNGSSWSTFNNGLSDFTVEELAYDGAAVYVSTISGVYAFAVSSNIIPIAQATVSVFPNPSTGAVIIHDLKPASYTIEVYDVEGKLLFNEKGNFSGSKALNLNLAKGVYFIRISDSKGSRHSKVVIE